MTDVVLATSSATEGITIVRRFAAPRALVFQAWTQPEHFAHWFGGHNGVIPLETVAMDVRPGGAWRATMYAGPDRFEIHWKGHYVEVVAPERLVFTLTDQPNDDSEPCTVILTEVAGQTEMRFHQPGGYLAEEQYAAAKAGWLTFFDAMAELLAA